MPPSAAPLSQLDSDSDLDAELLASTVDHSGADEGDGFEGIGLPVEAGWYVSATLYWIAGLAIVLIDQLSSESAINPVIAVLGAIALAASPLMLLGARFAPDAPWGAPTRLLVPAAFFFAGAFVGGDAINALVLLYFFPLLAVAYMHKPSLSIPFCSLSIITLTVTLLVHDSSYLGIARAIVLTGVTVSLVTGLIVSQMRLRKAVAESQELAVTDPLTGLANLRGLRTRLRNELARHGDRRIVMLGIDLDDFKEVNDRFNYALGDATLQEVAQAIEAELGEHDMAARRGGDEFVVLAVTDDSRHMARFQDRLAAAIERARRSLCPDVNPRASITRITHLEGEDVDEFLRRLDLGLHVAKIDAHPERATGDVVGLDDHPEIDSDAQTDILIAGARRSRLSLAHGDRNRGLAWRLTAGVALVNGLIVLLIELLDLIPQSAATSASAAGAGLLAVSAGAAAVASIEPERHWMHIPMSLILLLTIAFVTGLGDDASVAAALCLLPVPLAVIAVGWRQASPYAVAATIAYAYFMFTSDAQFATLQALLMIGVSVVLMVLLERGDKRTSEYIAATEAIALIDPLTGAANVRGFALRVDSDLAASDPVGGELTLLMIDLENFKAVNDRYSHSVGDALLVEVTAAIDSLVRREDLVVRRGGDEFVVVLADDQSRDADALCSEILTAIRLVRMKLTPDIAASATVVAVTHDEGEPSETFKHRADEALRIAKSAVATSA
jgi:diguanylate cyclase (GGDEF)-like protein